ncbi:C40 family peptidase [Acetivibrio ethanolgignens]|uniref:NlpC/P60 domain-containing protein n=1 Tax=Acetivibrio ethanolgignens TaxID=290052 RepID=A0A0V8QF44_9FIRM|nr:C40 family peptidase [Acetivibrio ethanolgignens]KSV59168.1 hypothetical protein ASU35_10450 [Acetivibrio ethanolgignens]
MRYAKFVLAAVLLTLLTGTISYAKTTDTEKYACVTKTTPILSEARNSASVYGYLPQGTVIKYGKNGIRFIEINYRGKSGFVSKNDVVTGNALEVYVKQHPTLFKKKAITLAKCKMWDGAEPGAKVIATASKGTEFIVNGIKGSTVKVGYDGRDFYINKGYVKIEYVLDVKSFPVLKRNGTKRDKIVDYALQFVGNPYVWGGESLTSGADCSGFVRSVLKEFNINLQRCSYQQAEQGKKVALNKLQPGDLVFYMRGNRIGHVAMYIGDGKIVQARGQKYGIVVTDIDYNNNTPAWARNVID